MVGRKLNCTVAILKMSRLVCNIYLQLSCLLKVFQMLCDGRERAWVWKSG